MESAPCLSYLLDGSVESTTYIYMKAGRIGGKETPASLRTLDSVCLVRRATGCSDSRAGHNFESVLEGGAGFASDCNVDQTSTFGTRLAETEGGTPGPDRCFLVRGRMGIWRLRCGHGNA
jgi:hypothetical protein